MEAARRVPFALIILLGVAACGVVTVLPTAGVLVPLELAVGAYGTLLLPGAVILRLLGWPRSLAAALPGCAAWSLVALAPGLMLALLVEQGLVVAILWLLAVIAAGLLIGRGKPVEVDVGGWGPFLLFAAGLIGFSALVWLSSWNNIGDAVEHIARMRKLTELDPPRSLEDLGLLPPETGLHPGYAFPLWHAAGAVTVWISGLEETFMFRYWPSMLVLFAATAIYRAGRVMFGCRAAGAATCIGYLGLFAFPDGGVGYFSQLSYPGYISIFLFWPLVIERAFTYLQQGGREPLWTMAAASFIVTAIHPSYAPFMVMVIGGFLVARTVLTRNREDLRRLGFTLAALVLPFLLFLVWLYPIANSSASNISDASGHFGTLVGKTGGLVYMEPDWLTRGGPAAIAALLLLPLASAATRTRAAAFIAGGSLVVILTLIVPFFFTPFADVVSISQGRRFLFYLPWAFALAGGALVLARLRYFGVAGALAAGVLLHLKWPGDFQYHLERPGPGWLAWVAAAGALFVLVAGALKKVNLTYGNGWALPILIAGVLPIAVAGLDEMKINRNEPDFNRRLLTAVRENVTRDDVLLALPQRAYRLSAQVPIYIMAAYGGHGGDTIRNQHALRRRDANRFFNPKTTDEEAQEIVTKWDVQWVLVRKDEYYPRGFLDQFTPVYEDDHFALYPVDSAAQARTETSRTS
jgi:hypothetical protein